MRGQIFAAAFIGLSFAASAEPVVRYAAVDGTGDGTSWENAATLADAYAAVGDNADGGEVWVKTGVYQFKGAGGSTTEFIIPMKSNVAVIGGFAGTETSAEQADPVANPAVMTAQDVNTCWTTNWPYGVATSVKLHEGTKVNYPPYDLHPDARGWCASGNVYNRKTPFGAASGSSVENCTFEGLTFVNCQYRSIDVQGSASGLVVRNCRFFGSGSCANTGGTGCVYLADTDVEVSDCEFVGAGNCIYDNAPNKEVRCRVRNCTFTSCIGYYGYYGTAINAVGRATPDVRGCRFENCSSVSQPASSCGIVGLSDGTHEDVPCVVSNCVFRGNWLQMDRNTMAPLTLNRGNRCKTEIVDCLFEGNTNIQSWTSGNTSRGVVHSACIGVTCTHDAKPQVVEVRNSRFSRNFASRGNEPTYTYGSGSVLCTGYGSKVITTFANCTIEDNRAESPDGCVNCGQTFYCWRSECRVALVNCVLNGNDCFQEATRVPEFYQANNASPISIINTIMWHDNAEYLPFYEAAYYGIANSDILNSPVTSETTPTNNGYVYDLYAEDPKLEAELVTNLTAVAQHRPSAQAGRNIRRGGRPVWRGTDGFYYFYDSVGRATTPWRRADDKSTCLNDGQAADVGLSLAAAPIADAFGAPRVKGKIALGPLNTDPRGLMLLLR